MRYYRCKCGDSSAFGSMPPDRCAWCEKCDSSLAEASDLHRERVPHDFSSVQSLKTDQGDATITRCRWCHLTSDEIARAP